MSLSFLFLSDFPSESGTSGKQSGNVSLDVLPVKGPQGPPFLSKIAHPAQDTPTSEERWAVHPEHLILVAPPPCEYLGKNFSEVHVGVRVCISVAELLRRHFNTDWKFL